MHSNTHMHASSSGSNNIPITSSGISTPYPYGIDRELLPPPGLGTHPMWDGLPVNGMAHHEAARSATGVPRELWEGSTDDGNIPIRDLPPQPQVISRIDSRPPVSGNETLVSRPQLDHVAEFQLHDSDEQHYAGDSDLEREYEADWRQASIPHEDSEGTPSWFIRDAEEIMAEVGTTRENSDVADGTNALLRRLDNLKRDTCSPADSTSASPEAKRQRSIAIAAAIARNAGYCPPCNGDNPSDDPIPHSCDLCGEITY